jgi:hypothetical protein
VESVTVLAPPGVNRQVPTSTANPWLDPWRMFQATLAVPSAWTIVIGVALASCFVRAFGGVAIRRLINLPDALAKAIERQAIGK